MKTVSFTVTISGPDRIVEEAVEQARDMLIDPPTDTDEETLVSLEVREEADVAAGITAPRLIFKAVRNADDRYDTEGPGA